MIDNLRIPTNFFEEETKEGFVIHPIIKRCMAADIKVLAEIDRICRKYGLTYYADFGTLLGAVRHKGFIPWDDDIDITMPRADYMRFRQVAPQELPPSYVLSSYGTNPDHIQPFMTVFNRRDVGQNDSVTSDFYDCPFMIGVEVYPLDAITANKEERDVQTSLYQIVYNCAFYYKDYEADGSLFDRLDQIQSYTGAVFNSNTSTRTQLWLLADQIASMYSPNEASWFTRMYQYAIYNTQVVIEPSWYRDSIDMDFEYISIPVPIGYHEYLTRIYGDYNLRKQDGSTHQYPFFRPQLDHLPDTRKKKLQEEEAWIFE